MITEGFIFLITIVAGLGFVSVLKANGGGNSGLSRAFAGGSVSMASHGMLSAWFSVESFIRACYAGTFSFIGFLFLLSLMALVVIWSINIFTVRRLVL